MKEKDKTVLAVIIMYLWKHRRTPSWLEIKADTDYSTGEIGAALARLIAQGVIERYREDGITEHTLKLKKGLPSEFSREYNETDSSQMTIRSSLKSNQKEMLEILESFPKNDNKIIVRLQQIAEQYRGGSSDNNAKQVLLSLQKKRFVQIAKQKIKGKRQCLLSIEII